MRVASFSCVVGSVALSLVACRDVEIVDGSGGSSSTTSVTTSTASSTTGTGTTLVCGGKMGSPCPADAYCDFGDGSCGVADQTGVCVPKPSGCTADCPGVCGCDGQFYCNACSAEATGVDVSSATSCLPDGALYSSQIWMGGLDHLVVRKADFDHDLCFQVFLDAPMNVQAPYLVTAPQSFAVSNAIVVQGAENCASNVAPDPLIIQANSGKGAVDWKLEPMMSYPCELSIDVVLTFESSASWLTPTQTLQATGVKVDGGCF